MATRAQIYREQERRRRELERQYRAAEKAQRLNYLEKRVSETDELNQRLADSIEDLGSLLADTLEAYDYLEFSDLKKEIPAFVPGALGTAEAPPREADFVVAKPGALARLIPGAVKRHEVRRKKGEEHFLAAVNEHARRERDRLTRLAGLQAWHARAVEAIQLQHEEIDRLREAFEAADPEAMTTYFALCLDRSSYPAGFPRQARVAVVPESKQLVIDYEFPKSDCVPAVATHKYLKAKDQIVLSARPVGHIRSLYASVIAQICLRTLHEVFEADRGARIENVVFNGHVSTIDPGTGQPSRPCLITVRTSRDIFSRLDLTKVDPAACLRTLNAAVSKSPLELAPVRPVLEFNMVDPRFIQETDVLAGLDRRPNLMELSPSEFESLITNLFQRMGLETKLTQASRDGGVDCVAFDPRPIFGGKVVIQAKRYKNTVGVSAVRDLFGTLQNEGASKGILVTTSGYGSASFDFAAGKPIELLSGTNLLYLLAEHAGIDAKIVMPEDWRDPEPDIN